jgi:cysteine-rich repeat protein
MCLANCSYRPAVCGDAVTEFGEQCDAGFNHNGVPGGLCLSDCLLRPAVCGDGIVEPGEECDDGNTVTNDGCNFPTCENTCLHNPAGLIPGYCVSLKNDCVHEWCSAVNPPPVSRGPFAGLPGRIITCANDDPTCDFGPKGDQMCTFRFAMCFNVKETRESCKSSGTVGSVGMRRPDFDHPRSDADVANVADIQAALIALGGKLQPGGDGGHATVTFDPPLTAPNTCTRFVSFQVPLRRGVGGFVQNRVPIRIRVFPGPDPVTFQVPHYDGDQLDLICTP